MLLSFTAPSPFTTSLSCHLSTTSNQRQKTFFPSDTTPQVVHAPSSLKLASTSAHAPQRSPITNMWHSEILIQCLNNTLIVVEAGKNGPGGEKCFQGNSRKKEQRPGSGTTSVVEKMSYLHPGRSRGISLALCHSFGFFPARETVCAMSELFSAACP